MKLAAIAILLLAAPLALAQLAPQPTPPTCASPDATAFDVATVKPIDQPAGRVSINTHADSIKADATVNRIIAFAYNLRDFQVTGGPGWLSTATWDVMAKVDQPPANYDSLSSDARGVIQRQRMAAALAQRFALKCHFETKELPVFNLVLAKGGPKPALMPTPADAKKKGSFSIDGHNRANRMEANGVPLESLAANLAWSLGRTVIDKTGLAGLYDFTLTYTSDSSANSPASASDDATSSPTIFTALEEQLGLRVESAKGPVPVLVIDSIDKPSEN